VSMVSALVLSGHLSLIRSLGRRGIDVVTVEYQDAQPGHLSRYASQSLRIPDPLQDEGAFIQALLDIGPRFHGSVLFPMFDSTLVACSRHKESLSEHYRVAAEDWEVTRVYLEKARTAKLAASLDIPRPLTTAVGSAEDAQKCAERLQPPYIVKPDRTHEFQAEFGSKMFAVETFDDLQIAMRRCLDADIPVMVQEFIPGVPSDGAVYAGYFDNGEPLAETTHEKVRDGPPVYGSPRVVISRHIPEIVDPARQLMRATRYTGFACVEFKRDGRDGVFKLMEVNARHNLAGALHVRSGVDYPWIHYQHLVHGRRPNPSEASEGVYWIDVYRDIGYSLRFVRRERLSLSDFVKPYLGSPVFRTLDWRDPKPFLAFPFQRLAAKMRQR
jgi:D-aspartate ligase